MTCPTKKEGQPITCAPETVIIGANRSQCRRYCAEWPQNQADQNRWRKARLLVLRDVITLAYSWDLGRVSQLGPAATSKSPGPYQRSFARRLRYSRPRHEMAMQPNAPEVATELSGAHASSLLTKPMACQSCHAYNHFHR